MWEDDSIINEICGMIGGVADRILPEYDPGVWDGVHTEALGETGAVRMYADGSFVREIRMRVSLTVRLLSYEIGMMAIAALERLASFLEREAAICGSILRVRTVTWPSKLRERGGSAEYGMTLGFYVLIPCEGCGIPLWYINTGSASSPVWEQVGEGFVRFSEVRETELYSRRYIHERDFRRETVGYISGIRYRFEAERGEGAAKLLRLAWDSGRDVHAEVLSVFPDSCGFGLTEGRRAVRRSFSAAPSGVSIREDDGALMYDGTLWACGAPVCGTFCTDTLTFTPDTLTSSDEAVCGAQNDAEA